MNYLLKSALFAGVVSALAWSLRSQFKSQFFAHFLSGIFTHTVLEVLHKNGHLEQNIVQSD